MEHPKHLLMAILIKKKDHKLPGKAGYLDSEIEFSRKKCSLKFNLKLC